MSANIWLDHRDELIEAFARTSGATKGRIRTELLHRALSPLLEGHPRKVLDVGGGFGELAYRLAEHGHEVTVVDPCIEMLNSSTSSLDARVRGIRGSGEDIHKFELGTFNIILCHSVIQYIEDPRKLFDSISFAATDDAWLSLLVINDESIAMREGLSGRWTAASSLILGNEWADSHYIRSHHHSLGTIEEMLKDTGFRQRYSYGVGVFTDHLDRELSVQEFTEAVEADWHAGAKQPYRGVARCVHILAAKAGVG